MWSLLQDFFGRLSSLRLRWIILFQAAKGANAQVIDLDDNCGDQKQRVLNAFNEVTAMAKYAYLRQIALSRGLLDPREMRVVMNTFQVYWTTMAIGDLVPAGGLPNGDAIGKK